MKLIAVVIEILEYLPKIKVVIWMRLLLDILKILPQYFAPINNIMDGKCYFLGTDSLKKFGKFLLHLYAIILYIFYR
jgi:hypothetical protein